MKKVPDEPPAVTARCPFCEAVHPVARAPHPIQQELDCPCGAIGLLCAPDTEPETSVRLSERGFGDTKADIVSDTLSVVWGKPWVWRWSSWP